MRYTGSKKTIEDYQRELAVVLQKLKPFEAPDNSYTAQVARSFHLGMVGGSGRNTHRLNKIREREMEKSIADARAHTDLVKERNWLEAQIKDLEEDGPAKRLQKRQERNQLLAEYWNNLKVGDQVDVGNMITIVKKNSKSLISDGNCKWSAAEIIGREAAALLK